MFSGWMLLWFSPNSFQREHIHTDVGRPWIVRPSTCTDAVLFKQLSHFGLCWGSWQWTSNPATICPCSTLSAFCGCVMTSIASDWLTLPCFLSLQWLKQLFSGLSAVCLHTSAGEPRAAASLLLGSSHVCETWIRSVTWESENEAFRSLFHAFLLHHSQVLP